MSTPAEVPAGTPAATEPLWWRWFCKCCRFGTNRTFSWKRHLRSVRHHNKLADAGAAGLAAAAAAVGQPEQPRFTVDAGVTPGALVELRQPPSQQQQQQEQALPQPKRVRRLPKLRRTAEPPAAAPEAPEPAASSNAFSAPTAPTPTTSTAAEELHLCQPCGVEFQYRSRLERHLQSQRHQRRTELGVPAQVFWHSCARCGWTGLRLEAVERHHTSTRYPCPRVLEDPPEQETDQEDPQPDQSDEEEDSAAAEGSQPERRLARAFYLWVWTRMSANQLPFLAKHSPQKLPPQLLSLAPTAGEDYRLQQTLLPGVEPPSSSSASSASKTTVAESSLSSWSSLCTSGAALSWLLGMARGAWRKLSRRQQRRWGSDYLAAIAPASAAAAAPPTRGRPTKASEAADAASAEDAAAADTVRHAVATLADWLDSARQPPQQEQQQQQPPQKKRRWDRLPKLPSELCHRLFPAQHHLQLVQPRQRRVRFPSLRLSARAPRLVVPVFGPGGLQLADEADSPAGTASEQTEDEEAEDDADEEMGGTGSGDEVAVGGAEDGLLQVEEPAAGSVLLPSGHPDVDAADIAAAVAMASGTATPAAAVAEPVAASEAPPAEPVMDPRQQERRRRQQAQLQQQDEALMRPWELPPGATSRPWLPTDSVWRSQLRRLAASHSPGLVGGTSDSDSGLAAFRAFRDRLTTRARLGLDPAVLRGLFGVDEDDAVEEVEMFFRLDEGPALAAQPAAEQDDQEDNTRRSLTGSRKRRAPTAACDAETVPAGKRAKLPLGVAGKDLQRVQELELGLPEGWPGRSQVKSWADNAARFQALPEARRRAWSQLAVLGRSRALAELEHWLRRQSGSSGGFVATAAEAAADGDFVVLDGGFHYHNGGDSDGEAMLPVDGFCRNGLDGELLTRPSAARSELSWLPSLAPLSTPDCLQQLDAASPIPSSSTSTPEDPFEAELALLDELGCREPEFRPDAPAVDRCDRMFGPGLRPGRRAVAVAPGQRISEPMVAAAVAALPDLALTGDKLFGEQEMHAAARRAATALRRSSWF